MAIGIKISVHSKSVAGGSTPRHFFFEGNLPREKNCKEQNSGLLLSLLPASCQRLIAASVVFAFNLKLAVAVEHGTVVNVELSFVFAFAFVF